VSVLHSPNAAPAPAAETHPAPMKRSRPEPAWSEAA
jgi:hypothetical protein